MENLRVLEGSEVFFRGLQHRYHQFKSGTRLSKISGMFLRFFFAHFSHAAEKFSCKHVESSYFVPPPIVKQKSKLAYGSDS